MRRHVRFTVREHARSPLLALIPLLVLILFSLAGPSARAADPPLPRPVVLALQELHLFDGPGIVGADVIGSLAVSADARRAYIGLRYSYRSERDNLVVVEIDRHGHARPGVRRYADSSLPLPKDTQSLVNDILLHPFRPKLYLATSLNAAVPAEATQLLTVYELDARGLPAGRPRSFECGNPHKSLLALAIHPTGNVLYLVGWGSAAVHTYKLDPSGEPQGQPIVTGVGGYGKYAIALSQDARHLYLGTYPDVLEIVDLDPAGMPVGTPRSIKGGSEENYLVFRYTPDGLLLEQKTPKGQRLGFWPFDVQGSPLSSPQVRSDVQPSAWCADPRTGRMWVAVDVTSKQAASQQTGSVQMAGVVAEDFNAAQPKPLVPLVTRAGQQGARMAVSANGTPVLLTKQAGP